MDLTTVAVQLVRGCHRSAVNTIQQEPTKILASVLLGRLHANICGLAFGSGARRARHATTLNSESVFCYHEGGSRFDGFSTYNGILPLYSF